MGEKTSRAKVSVALIGVGSTWETHYRDAIHRLASKLRVQAVCDSVLMRAATVADEYEATPVCSPWMLTQRTDLHAWLIFDPGWFETYPASLAVRFGRTALYANPFQASVDRLLPILRGSVEHGESLMPEFPRRFTPATTRLRELIATRLGPVRSIEISISLAEANPAGVSDWLSRHRADAISLFDWCNCLIGQPSTGVTAQFDAPSPQFDIAYSARNRPGEPARARFRFEVLSGCRDVEPTIVVETERGSAIISSPATIAWQAADEQAQETLGNERSPYEIILDQLCRRALGGLVPVPTVRHALQAIETVVGAMDAVAAVQSRSG